MAAGEPDGIRGLEWSDEGVGIGDIALGGMEHGDVLRTEAMKEINAATGGAALLGGWNDDEDRIFSTGEFDEAFHDWPSGNAAGNHEITIFGTDDGFFFD